MSGGRSLRTVLPLLMVVACGGKPAPKSPEPPADPIPNTAGPPCTAVADHVAIVVLAGASDDGKLRADLRTRCDRDRWSDEARSCFAAMENDSEADGCLSKLTAQQRDAAASLVAPAGDDTGGQGTAMSLEEGKMGKSAPKGGAKESAKDTAPHTRGPVRKTPAKPKDADPCQGGE